MNPEELIAPFVVLIGLGMLLGGTTVALLAGLRLLAAGRRLSGILAIVSGGLLGTSSLLMPVELAAFASFDNNKHILDLLEDIFDEPWFLMAWAGLMIIAAIPTGLYGLALWFAVPRAWEAVSGSDPADPDPEWDERGRRASGTPPNPDRPPDSPA